MRCITQSKPLELPGNCAGKRLLVHSGQLAVIAQRLSGCVEGIRVNNLALITDAPAQGRRSRRSAEEPDRAAIDFEETQQGVNRGRIPCPVRAYECHDAALFDRQAYTFDRNDLGPSPT